MRVKFVEIPDGPDSAYIMKAVMVMVIDAYELVTVGRQRKLVLQYA